MSAIEQAPGQTPQPEIHGGHPVLSIEQLIRERHTDELTGLHNRRWLTDHLPSILEEDKGKTGLLFMDLDGFKEINDTLGHDAGDEHLRQTATRLRQTTNERPGDTVVRLGGDEFLIVLRGISNDKDLKTVESRIQGGMDEIGSGGSIGSVLHTNETAAELMNKADEAMYAVKNARKRAAFEALPRRKRVAALVGNRLMKYAGLNPPRQ